MGAPVLGQDLRKNVQFIGGQDIGNTNPIGSHLKRFI